MIVCWVSVCCWWVKNYWKYDEEWNWLYDEVDEKSDGSVVIFGGFYRVVDGEVFVSI